MLMKRALVHHKTLATIGGGKLVLLKFVETLTNLGYQVDVTSCDDIENMPQLWERMIQTFEERTYPNNFYEIPSSFYNPVIFKNKVYKHYVKFASIMKRNNFLRKVRKKYDMVVDVQDGITFPANIVYVLDPPPSFKVPIFPPHRTMIKLILWTFMLKANKNRLILTTSKYTRKKIFEATGLPSLVMNPPVKVKPHFKSFDERRRKDIVVTISRIAPGKRLEIVPEVAKGVKRAKFLIMGLPQPGVTQNVVRKIMRTAKQLDVENRVKIIVGASFTDKLMRMSRAKIYLHTKPYESFGVTIVESMSAGLVPILPRSGGQWTDILRQKDGVYGYSYDSVDEAIHKINNLLDNKKMIDEVKENNRGYVQTFDECVFTKRLAKLIEKTRIMS